MASNFYAKYSGFGGSGGGGGGVTSINTLTGAITLAAGTGIGLSTLGNTITINSTETFGDLTDAGTDGIVITGGTGAVHGAGTQIAQHVADATHNGYLSSTDWNTFNNKQSALTLGNLTDVGTDGIVVTGGTGAVVGAGTSIAQHVADATHNGYLSSVDWVTFNGKQAAGNYITALTGDGTATGPGSVPFTLATVNGNVGSFGSSTAIPSFTVNAKGLITAASTNAVIAPAGTLTGTTLAANVVSSSLTSVGTITTGVWNGTTIAIANGGTGQTTQTAAFNALSPTTTKGDLIVHNGTNNVRQAVSTDGFVLTADSAQTTGIKWAAAASTVPTQTILTTGSGTYTTPAGCTWIRVRMVGGGGGGGSRQGVGGNGSDGTDTNFGDGVAAAGHGGVANAGAGGAGGTVTLGTGWNGIAISGAYGMSGQGNGAGNVAPVGGSGGVSPFGGNGNGGGPAITTGGTASGYGSGGGGGGSTGAQNTGGAGGAGGYIDALIITPDPTYAYDVGALGAGNSDAGDGANGIIILEEHY